MNKTNAKLGGSQKKLFFAAGIVIVAVIAVLALNAFNVISITGNAVIGSNSGTDAMQYASRQTYFKEAFQPDRSKYLLFEKASAFLKKPIAEIPAFFSLKSEEEIFASLPEIPADFSEIAFLLASGKYYTIGFLDEGYYKQPEFYPNFKEFGLKYWTQPDPKYWVTSGYGTYPADQEDTLTIGSKESFTAVVFLNSGWGVQTFQGATLMADSEARKNFDITISPKNVLLEPNFPKFYKNWAEKIVIEGKLKPETKPGTYYIKINLESPPENLRDQWLLKYRNLYFDAASGIKPEGSPITLKINVKE